MEHLPLLVSCSDGMGAYLSGSRKVAGSIPAMLLRRTSTPAHYTSSTDEGSPKVVSLARVKSFKANFPALPLRDVIRVNGVSLSSLKIFK